MHLLSSFLIPFLILFQNMAPTKGASSPPLRRYREVRESGGIIYSSDSSRKKTNRNSYKLNGRKYFVKKERRRNLNRLTKTTENKKRKDKIHESRKASGTKRDRFFRYNRKPLDGKKKKGLKSYNRNGLH